MDADWSSFARRAVNQSGDSNIGSAREPNSASSVLLTLAPVAAFAAVWLVLFLLFRIWYPRYYHPRTFLGSLRSNERTPQVRDAIFAWIGDFYSIPDTWILNHHTLDGFLFIRFIKISVVSCFVGCLVTWPVLFPINATGGGGKEQFAILTLANVTNKFKYFAHAICAIIFFSFVLYMITRESIYFINLRQAYLMSPLYASRISSRTVMFNAVPQPYMNEERLRAMLGPSVRRIWLASNTKDLDDKVEERDKAALKLEAAETKLIKTANCARIEADKKAQKFSSEEYALEEGSGSAATKYLKPEDRPTHRLGKVPLVGKKVDTIDWCRSQLQKLIPEIEKMQAEQRAGKGKLLNSVFVEFETLSDAQGAYQSLSHHQVLHMYPRHTGMNPQEVIWSNLRIRWWERIIRQTATISAVVALIIFWSFPVAFVGAISNINYLTNKLHFLRFINALPHWLLGIVTGLLPSILLAVLMSILPIFLRLMATQGGDPTLSAVELTVQNSYFGFQVVQVFLVATLGSAASSVTTKIIQDPTSVASLLANNIPLASTFYLSYFILQGLGVVSGILLGLSGLVMFKVLGKLLDKTPRKMYKRWINLSGVGWGTVFPIYTNLFVIAICYAAIAPLVLGFATIGLYLFYFAYRYNLMFVANSNVDTKGRIYPRALQQLFVGLYVAEICLIGLFAIGVGSSVGALGPLILMIIFLIFTALYHVSLNSALTPLIEYLPKSIDAEERRLLAAESGEVDPEHPLDHGPPSTTNAKGKDGIEKPITPPTTSHQTSVPPSPDNDDDDAAATPHPKPNMFRKWLRPDIYNDYETMRRLVPKDIDIEYPDAVAADAYFPPSVTSSAPLLWVPRDPGGVSAREASETSKVLPMTDEGAWLDAKNRVVWNSPDGRPPIYEETIYY